ncbi:MAG: PAS domain S-box protein [Pseudomonadota bacterium]
MVPANPPLQPVLDPPPRSFNYLANFIALSSLVLLLLAFFLLVTYKQTEESVRTASRNEALVLVSQVDATLRRLEASANLIADQLLAGRAPTQIPAHEHELITRRLAALAQKFPEIYGFSLFDEEGKLRLSSYTRPDGINIADMEHFQAARRNPDNKLHFTETLKARANDRMVVAAYRALLDHDGKFVGMLGASINLDHYARIFSQLQVGEHGMVSIRRSDDSKLVVRWPEVAEKANNLATGILPYQSIQAGETSGVVRYVGKTDNVDRIFAFHKISDYPFFVLVGRAVEEQFHSWRNTAYLSSLLVFVALALLGWFLYRLQSSQSALQRENEKYLALLHNASDGIHILDGNGNLIEASDSFCAMLGYTRAEMIGMNVREWDASLTEEERQIKLQQQLESPARVEFETLHRRKDGPVFPVQVSGYPLLLEGRMVLFNSSHDITERKRAEEALQQLNSELEERVAQRTSELQMAHQQLQETQFAMDSVGIGISWADYETGQFTYANRYAAEFLGYTLDEYLQLRVTDIDPNFPVETYDEVRERIRQEKRLQFETTQKTKDGHLLPVEMTIFYHAGTAGERPKFIAFMSDIAQRKEAAQALLQAKEAADAANRAKSAFLANMSHEIRTPLNAILGLNHLMHDDSLTPKQVERLAKMEIAGRHLLSIINDILDLSKIEAGRLELQTDNFHLSAVLDNVASMIRESASAKGLTLEIDPDGVPLWLRGDAIRLRQALLNFASNAVKFTEQGKITLRALLLEDKVNGLLCRFEVADSGIGLTPEQLDRLFQNFQQADESTARKYGGTGLGLALTKRLVELMGGKVGADSTAGDGSTFWFTVPLQRGHGPMPQQPATHAGQGSEARLLQGHRGARILLAEDNPINTEVVLELLHATGMDVAVAENGRAAVELVRLQHFDLILMDMQMPVMDGTEAARTIRTMPERAAIPILALTANVFAEDRRACLAAGMVDMLTKPVDPATLYDALLKWLPQRNAIPDSPPPPPSPAPATPAVPAASDAEILERLRILSGIDVDYGLKLLHGKTGRYINLLRNFLKSQGEDWGKLEHCLATGDCAEAKRQIHSLKGAAGTLALTEIATLATHLDTLLGEPNSVKMHAETIRELLEEIRTEMNTFRKVLSD